MKSFTDFFGDDRNETVVDENPFANGENFGKILVIKPDHILGALLFESIIGGQFDFVASLQSQFFSAIVLNTVKHIL